MALPNNQSAFAYNVAGSNTYVYYCDINDGKLHRYNDNVTSSSDSTYYWPISTMECTGRTVIYSSSRNSLIFMYTQNGQEGIAEYLDR